MAVHTELTSAEAADRVALRELFDAYAHCAERRDAEGQKAMFTADTRFAVYVDGEGSKPTYVLEGRDRYLDTFAKIDGGWYFAERKLLPDWSETRPSRREA
jgi:hypothetical protein